MGEASRRDRFDRHMMAIALMMAKRGLGTTAPNPSVGAVVADEATGEVIARATTAPGGRPHAEPLALAAAGSRAEGATIYVTLEPCSHHGKTPPCAEAIVAAGIKRAVVAIEDPDPRVAGRGLDLLRRAGIDVSRGLLAAEAHWLTRGHIVRVTERRPFVQLKLALDASGNVPRGADGKPVWVTSQESRAAGHMLRTEADAILVGRQTIIDDTPQLDCRLPGLTHRSPLRVMLDRDLVSPATGRAPRGLMFASPDAVAREKLAMVKYGIEAVAAPVVGGRLWLPAVLESLAERGVTRLLVEGGPATWRSFADLGLVDEVVMFQAGGSNAQGATLPLEVLSRHIDTAGLAPHSRALVGPDIMTVFRRILPPRLGGERQI